MRCLHDILGVTLWDRMQNMAIQEKIGELLVEDQLRQRRLQWFGHVWRMATRHPQRQRCVCVCMNIITCSLILWGLMLAVLAD